MRDTVATGGDRAEINEAGDADLSDGAEKAERV